MQSTFKTIVFALLLAFVAAEPSIEWGLKGNEQPGCNSGKMEAATRKVFADAFSDFGATIVEDKSNRMLKKGQFRSIWCDICDWSSNNLSLTCLVYFKPCTGKRQLIEGTDYTKDEIKAIKAASKDLEKTLKAIESDNCDTSKFYVKFNDN